ncbi:helix-turn-helix transcriptional regulator [Bradyrhizobium guangxiense]|uniref:helix-turn-helix transcriptional regulator n=1 Tax=Bradyrhizobium guangxiense TaxID=1325115 RepID=UPI001008C53A|nr:helix-turn-helix transcriptional regulator [Bradyrhizobium guangxiense]
MGRPSKKAPSNFARNARTLGENVRRLRQLAELSQVGLAEAADLRQALISEIERGESNPRLESLTKIADALKVRLTELFNYDQ